MKVKSHILSIDKVQSIAPVHFRIVRCHQIKKRHHIWLLLPKVFTDLEKILSLKWRCPPWEIFHWWRGEHSTDPAVRPIVECSVRVSPGQDSIVLYLWYINYISVNLLFKKAPLRDQSNRPQSEKQCLKHIWLLRARFYDTERIPTKGKRNKIMQMKMYSIEKLKLNHNELPLYAYRNGPNNNKWCYQVLARTLTHC